MTDHPGEDFTGAELDEPLVDEPLVDDLLDETRRPDEDQPLPDPGGDAEYPHDPPEVPEPPG